MRTTGITRRIDELGRVVIPKEIRKNMHIKTGEMLEIFLNNQDEIILKKYIRAKENFNFIDKYIKSIGKRLNCEIYFTNLSNILISTEEEYNNSLLSDNFEDIINSKKINFSNLESLSITSNYKIEKPFDVYLISPNGDLLGFIIYKYKKEPTDLEKELVKFSNEFISNYLE